MEKNDIVRYTGESNSVLETGKEYKVFSVGETGLQLCIPTGFAGVSLNDVILVQIKG